jgi:hypothetical protein
MNGAPRTNAVETTTAVSSQGRETRRSFIDADSSPSVQRRHEREERTRLDDCPQEGGSATAPKLMAIGCERRQAFVVAAPGGKKKAARTARPQRGQEVGSRKI